MIALDNDSGITVDRYGLVAASLYLVGQPGIVGLAGGPGEVAGLA